MGLVIVDTQVLTEQVMEHYNLDEEKLSRLFGVSKRSVCRWAAGEGKPRNSSFIVLAILMRALKEPHNFEKLTGAIKRALESEDSREASREFLDFVMTLDIKANF